MVLAEIVSILVWFGLTYIFDNLVGISFLEAWTLTVGGGFSIVPTVFVTLFNPSSVLLWIIVGGLFVGNIGWGWLGIVFISRLFMSWAFDRTVPTALANVSDRFHTPYVAIIVASACTLVPMYLYFFVSFITTQVNGIFLFAVVWFLTALGAIILPFRRKAIFEAASWKARIGGFPVISLLGVIGAILFGYLGFNAVTNPAVASFSSQAQVIIVVVVLIPIAIFAASYFYNKAHGIDLTKVWAQIPPE